MTPPIKPYCLYGLQRPGDESPRYIGITCSSLRRRFLEHLRSKRCRHKDAWIAKMLTEGLKPVLIPLVVGLNKAGAIELERAMIKALRDAGHQLVNGTDGGEGASAGNKNSLGHKQSPEHRRKQSVRMMGNTYNTGHKNALGIKWTEESRAKLRGNKNCLGRNLAGRSSRFIGVSWHKQVRKWRATISANRKQSYLGVFDDEIDAACAYDAAARILYGGFARTNFPYVFVV